jgi:heme-degrading monooxygenase HmoA
MAAGAQQVVLINAFEVPADCDDEFISEWERARDFLREQAGYLDTALHRSLGPDAEFRFVNVAHWSSPQEFQAAMARPDFPGRQSSFRAHPALYSVVVEDKTPAEAAVGAILINAFEVPVEADEEFMGAWERTRQFMRSGPTYLGTRLHRSLSPDAEFRFVNIAPWESPQAFQTAIQDPGFREAAGAIRHRAHPSLFEAVRR